MKLLSHVLLLIVMLASRKCQELDRLSSVYDYYDLDMFSANLTNYDEDITAEYESINTFIKVSDVPEPNITVYQRMGDRENVIVLCKFAKLFGMIFTSFDLSVESELKYTMDLLECSSSDSSEICVFLVTVSSPASFTCVHEFYLNDWNLHSQTYNYSGPVLDPHEEGVSSFYICFSSFIAVGLFIMTAAVIVINIRSKTKDPINPTAVTNNDYVDT